MFYLYYFQDQEKNFSLLSKQQNISSDLDLFDF